MLCFNVLLIVTCFIASSAINPMLRRVVRVPLKQFKSVVHMSTSPISNSNSITLVDFKLPANSDEVIQNLMNDEIISNSIIGKSLLLLLATNKLYILDHQNFSL